ncbi:MAG: DNA cytosine methyltransferase [Nitrospinae bacterium]|nr:DNA cytosine methyltransferase [Nitrospinota bacterium]
MSVRPKLLDLFCGAGGAAWGYDEAGFKVFGVDIVEQPGYPFPMIVQDVLTLSNSFLNEFDAIHASPPCQAYSDLAARNGNGHEWPRLIEPIRDMLEASGKPFVIENVEGAPLRNPVVLCGTMFDGLRVIRHRLFEANFPIRTPPDKPHPLCHTLDKRKAHYGKTCEWNDYVQVTGGGNCSVAAARDAMQIPWMLKKEINEAIPPAYTRHVGSELLRSMGMARQPSMKDLIKEHFLARQGEVVSKNELQELVYPRSEWARRIRELIREEGWPIQTQNDSADLGPGEYRLSGDPPSPGTYDIAPSISQAQRARILERNGYTCQACGVTVDDLDPQGRPVRLQIDHHQARTHGGRTSDLNLRVLCATCNQGARNLTAEPPSWTWLLTQIRRTSREDQMQALEWLKDKFKT